MIKDPPEFVQKVAAGLVGTLVFPTPVGPVSTEEFLAGTTEAVALSSGLPAPLSTMAAVTLCAWLDQKGYIVLQGEGDPDCPCGSGICGKDVGVSPAGRRWVTSLVPVDTFPTDEEARKFAEENPPWD